MKRLLAALLALALPLSTAGCRWDGCSTYRAGHAFVETIRPQLEGIIGGLPSEAAARYRAAFATLDTVHPLIEQFCTTPPDDPAALAALLASGARAIAQLVRLWWGHAHGVASAEQLDDARKIIRDMDRLEREAIRVVARKRGR